MKAIDIAKTFLGAREKPNNGGFFDAKLQAMMTEAGHKKGEAWCCYFAEGCFCEAVKPDTEKEAKLRKLFSANCVQTFANFQRAGYSISDKPVPGSLVIFQRFRDGVHTTTGHAAICDKAFDAVNFSTVEGNTNRDGGREGDSVWAKKRNTKARKDGLNVLGFITIE